MSSLQLQNLNPVLYVYVLSQIIHTCIYIYMYIHMYIHIYIYIYNIM
jgi:hypothetical protein